MRLNPKLRTENNQKKCWKGYDRIHERERIVDFAKRIGIGKFHAQNRRWGLWLG